VPEEEEALLMPYFTFYENEGEEDLLHFQRTDCYLLRHGQVLPQDEHDVHCIFSISSNLTQARTEGRVISPLLVGRSAVLAPTPASCTPAAGGLQLGGT